MPIIPGGEPSGGDPGPIGGTGLPCPGVCPIWVNEYIYVKIPGGTSYICGENPPVTIQATTTHLQLHVGETPEWVNGVCSQRGWSGVSIITPDPLFYEGSAALRVFVCCKNEKLSYPMLWFYYTSSIRLIGEPDPDIRACFEGACMTFIVCECYGTPDTGLPGYTHGTATLPNTDLPDYYGSCDCNIAVIGGGEEFEVKAFGFGPCDCVGIPYGPIPVQLECFNLTPPPTYNLIASGSISYTEDPSPLVPEGGPHWAGTMDSALGDGCYWDVSYQYNPDTDSFVLDFDGPNGVGCTAPPCSPYSTPGAVTAESCDPYYVRISFSGGVAVFTLGTPP